ncbi:MAG TPA: hypothetical protein VJ876_01010 [Bacteroidales bacterium]|nr:hypothetical protein [Bacteroidales bacterium]
MSGEEMINYLKRPQKLNEHSLSELRALLNRYPWFHTAHLLFLLNLKNINDPRYREFLKQSAVYIKDREKFLRLVNHLDASGQDAPSSGETSTDRQPEGAKEEDARSDPSKEGGETDLQPAQDKETRKAEDRKKDKDFSTEYLRNRISETLSEQKGDRKKEGAGQSEEGSDFFIIDKVSQVEEKMSRRLREQYEKQRKEKQQDAPRSGQENNTDSFELEKGREEKPSPPAGGGFAGEYFSEKDYRQTREEARKKQNDLIERFIKKAPELQNITPSNEKREDISKPSVREKEDLASERLIQVYIKQGYYQKAIEAYKKLSLKYPEKSDYFAEQIEKLRKNINKQQK